MSAALDSDDWGRQMADELRKPFDTGPDRLDFSWMTDNPDKMPFLPRRPLDWAALQDHDPSPREWVVRDWLPMGNAALLAGQGGIGKTLLAQTLGTCLVHGLDYFAATPRPRRVLIWAGEDDRDEIHRRQLAICNWAGIRMEDLSDRLILHPYVAQDITLAGLAFGQFTRTALMEELREQIADYRAEYVFLDSVARIFGGNENDRHQVTTFIAWLTEACRGAGVCLIGHPGKAAGSEFSGSTAWEGSVRARLYLGPRLPDSHRNEDEQPNDADAVRYLARRKANYSAKDWVKLEYSCGVLMPVLPTNGPEQHQPSGEYAKDVVIRAVRKLMDLEIFGNHGTRSPEYLPKLARQYDLLDRLSEGAFAAAMRKLIADKRLVTAQVGRYSNRNPKMGLRLAP